MITLPDFTRISLSAFRSICDVGEKLGTAAIKTVREFGSFGLFSMEVVRTIVYVPLKLNRMFAQVIAVGIESLPVVISTGATIGGVLAFHSFRGLNKFGADQFIGPLVFLAMAREFGPVLSAIMVTGRAGSAMTAEIGTMRISEQIDALTTLSINVNQYLIAPRVLASLISLPLLSIICTACGVFVGYLISVYTLNINAEVYIESVKAGASFADLFQGLFKAVIFGGVLSLVGCYKGMATMGGAKGVGKSTTESVVYASMSILVLDYIMTALMTLIWP
jgi:phospholipid/cholesterol/gamma-HCH transport system permease protein